MRSEEGGDWRAGPGPGQKSGQHKDRLMAHYITPSSGGCLFTPGPGIRDNVTLHSGALTILTVRCHNTATACTELVRIPSFYQLKQMYALIVSDNYIQKDHERTKKYIYRFT